MPAARRERLRCVVQARWGFGVWVFFLRISDHVGSMGFVLKESCRYLEVQVGSGTEPDR